MRHIANWGRGWLFNSNPRITQLISIDLSYNTDSTDVKIDRPVFEGKSSFKVLGLSFACKLNWSALNVFLVFN